MNDEGTYAVSVLWRCRHCDSRNELQAGADGPDGRTRWVIGVDHEPGCPDFVDLENMPAVEYDAQDFDEGIG